MDESWWLIEYVGAKPVPVYVSASESWYTTNPWEAKRFYTKEQAEQYMKTGAIPFTSPWAPVQHGFSD